MKTIDLSCDLGEAATAEEDAIEARLFPLITSANVACGGHAGDAESMRRAVERARAHGVALGAHPSYPDREGFGRRTISIAAPALIESLAAQVEALAAIAAAAGLAVTHVKPHGALYNDAHRDRGLADAIVVAVSHVHARLAFVCAAGSALFTAAREAGLPTTVEAFADRRQRPDGSLVPRSRPDALILDLDAAARQAVALATDGRTATLCIHSDTPRPVERLTAIRAALTAAGYVFRAPHG